MTDERYHAYQTRISAASTQAEFDAIIASLNKEPAGDPDVEALAEMTATVAQLNRPPDHGAEH